jgi:hypothetical protein
MRGRTGASLATPTAASSAAVSPVGADAVLVALLFACSPGGSAPRSPSDSDGAPAGELEVVLETATAPLVQAVEIAVPEPAPLDLLCTDDGSLGDEIVLRDRTDATEKRLVLTGLLADTAYTCTASSGDLETEFGFTTPPLPEPPPELLLGGTGPADGYTLFYRLIWDESGWNFHDSHLYVVDPNARVRWDYDLGNVNIDLDAHVLGGTQVLYGGALTIPPTIVGIDHAPVFELQTEERFHHQIEPLSDGRILTLTEIDNTNGSTTWTGFEVSVRELLTGKILWSWSSQSAVDAGTLPVSNEGSDPYHANSAQILEAEGEPHLALVSLRNLDRILGIDRDSGEVLWAIGRDGDFALVDEAGASLPDDQWFDGQHSLEARWPKVLLFDNGPSVVRADGTSTRALEIEVDTTARTVTKTWSYSDGGVREALGGDANRLASGNVLMTVPHCLPCGTSEGKSRIVEVTPEGKVAWRIDFGSERDLLYRAERVDPCSLFSNRAFCPSL